MNNPLHPQFGDSAAPDGLLARDNFSHWFGSSKVVNADGGALVVYHGTNQDVKAFCVDRRGANTGSVSSKVGFYFTENAAEAAEYANMSARKQVSNAPEAEANAERLLKEIDRANARGNHDLAEKLTLELEESEQEAMSGAERGANIMPVYLRIQNPMIIDFNGSVDLHAMTDMVDKAKEAGFDGLKMLNVYDPVAERTEQYDTTQWVAFEPTQIKSATGNNGAFNPDDPDLTDSKAVLLANSLRAKVAVDVAGLSLSYSAATLKPRT